MPLPERSERLSTRSYIIDVCITCGAHAVYPYRCGHRPEGHDPQREPWTVPITVEATTSSMHVLKAIRSATKEADERGAHPTPDDER